MTTATPARPGSEWSPTEPPAGPRPGGDTWDPEQARAAALVARTVRLPAGVDVDLVAIGGAPGAVLWQRDRAGLAGRGVALTIDLPDGLAGDGVAGRVAGLLDAIPVDDEVGRPGCGPVVLGALPFDRRAPAHLVVPAALAGRDADGTAWLTTVGPAGAAPWTPRP